MGQPHYIAKSICDVPFFVGTRSPMRRVSSPQSNQFASLHGLLCFQSLLFLRLWCYFPDCDNLFELFMEYIRGRIGYILAVVYITSPYVQKDMCEACAKQTTKAILDDIGDKNFSILVDESRDASIKEQMAVVLRYVNNKEHVIERFLGVEHVPDTTSAALKAALDAMLLGHDLSIHHVRGQGYDGASYMRVGSTSTPGLATIDEEDDIPN
ncbi:hypothetical protein U9M48_006583 [Paspalum notatum var. saurae]|uniref:DUF4371 domain-containing protein n=1 Tax=Paspalum notatum var. saurae TaxID=547442 RepID=A0AAQ3PY67_PASNO